MEKADWDVEQYRLAWDSDEQWEVRREFMLAHRNEFEEDRLVCLAQVYANIEFLGCSYPPEVMKQVAELSQGLSTNHRDQKKEREEIKFVKEVNDKANRANNTGIKRKFEQTNSSRWESPSVSTAHLNRSSAASYFTAESSNSWGGQQGSNKYQTQNYYTTSGFNSSQQQHQSGSQTSWSSGAANSYQPAIVNCGGGRGGGGHGGGGDNFGGSHWTGHRSGEMSTHYPAACRPNTSAQELPPKVLCGIELAIDGFAILESANGDVRQSTISKLHNSAQFAKKTIRFESDFVSEPKNRAVHRCAVQLEGVEVAAATGITKAEAKMAAAEAALHRLSAIAPTLKVKQAVVSDGAFSRDGICGEVADTADEKIGNDNVGNKMLRLMGWSGGGLGTRGREGITEPVKAQVVYGREGFGLASKNGIGKEFLKRFTKIVSDYARSDMLKDLVFTSEFTKEERAEMHKIAKRFRLKSTAHGQGADRYLVISRRFSGVQQLVQHVVSEGGSTEKYELILPGQS